MSRRVIFLVLLLIFSFSWLYAQSPIPYSVKVHPLAIVPLGSSSDLFDTGYGTGLSFSFRPASLHGAGLDAGLDLFSIPLASSDSIWILSGAAGPVFRLALGERFSLYAGGRAGYYLWGGTGWEPQAADTAGYVLGGEAGGPYRISGVFTAGLVVAYSFYEGLYNDISLGLNVRPDFPALQKQGSSIEIDTIRLLPLFPVLYHFYDDHPVGSVLIRNTGKKAVEDISVSLFVERYMDNPMQCGQPVTLAPGEEWAVDLFGLFNESVMEITEGTKVSAKISVSHPLDKENFSRDYKEALEFYNRNAMSWDDDKKIASFIMSGGFNTPHLDA